MPLPSSPMMTALSPGFRVQEKDFKMGRRSFLWVRVRFFICNIWFCSFSYWGRNSCGGYGWRGVGGALVKNTLPLRVARSGTKLPAPVVMPWQAEACRPCLEAKDRRLPKVFYQSAPTPRLRQVFEEFRLGSRQESFWAFGYRILR